MNTVATYILTFTIAIIVGITIVVLTDDAKRVYDKFLMKARRLTLDRRRNKEQLGSIADIVGIDKEVQDFLRAVSSSPNPDDRADLYAIQGCIELARCPNFESGWTAADVNTVLEETAIAMAPELEVLGERWRAENPENPDLTRFALKRIGGLRIRDFTTISLGFQRTCFSDVYGVQQHLDVNMKWSCEGRQTPRRKFYDYLWRVDQSGIPNFFVLHVVVTTIDSKLIVAQRSEKLHYFPNAWVIGFEEQLAEEDFEARSPLHAAVIRGVEEEVGVVGITEGNVSIHSIFLEYDNLNTGAIAIVKLPLSFEQIRVAWRERAADPGEIKPRGFHPLSLELPEIADILSSKTVVIDGLSIFPHNWHPTARYRLLTFCYQRWGPSATFRALERSRALKV